MTWLADLTVRSSAILLVGLVLCALLRNQSAAFRHWILAAAMAAAAAVGPLSLIVPVWHLPVPSPMTEPAVTATAVLTPDGTPRNPAVLPRQAVSIPWFALVWGTGAATGALVLLAGLGRLASIARRSKPVQDARWTEVAAELSVACGLRRPVRLLQTDTPDLLATFGVLRPRVLLPAHARDWPAARIHAVLHHELAHIRRNDWLVQIGAEALRTIYWFNPLLWAACARLRRESEHACDDAVLARGVPPRDYAAHLLELARACRRPGPDWLSAVPMARVSTLERRIAAMLNPSLDRAAVSRRTIGVTATLLVCITLSVAALRAGQDTPATLAGVVYDSTGAVLPEVQLTLEDAQQFKWQATTDATGRFEFPAIAPGRYGLEASLAGFRSLRQQIELRNASDWDRAITLQVGEVMETISVRASRLTGPSAVQGLQPVRVGGNIRPPRKLRDVKPIYPPTMREAGREAVVPMEAVIGPDGSVSSVRVLSADMHPDFAIAAVDAVRQWRFDPTLLNGEPVEVRMTVSIEFRLSQ